MQWRKQIADLFNIRTGEGNIVLLMMISSAATGIAINYYFTASSALFLAHYKIDILPYTIVATGFALFLTQFLYRQAAARLTPNRLLVASLVAVIGLIAVIRVSLLLIEARWLTFAILVLFRVMIIVLIVGFWGLANRLLTLGQSKRLFSLISAGDVISIMIGSFLVPLIVRTIGTENLFLLVLVSLVINLLAVLAILRSYRDQLAASNTQPTTAPPAAPAAKKTASVLRSRYVQLIFGLYVLAWTLNYALDYTFLGQLQARYASTPEKIASFIGILFGIIQLTNFVLKFFISGRLLSRYGLRFGLLALPVVFGVGIFLSVSAGVIVGTATLFFWLIITTKYSEEVLRESFNEPSTRILYQPMPLQQRASTLSLVEGTGFPLTALIAGTILVTFTITGTYTPLRITMLMLGLGAVWIIMALLTYGKYVETLRHAMTTRIFRGDQRLTGDATTLQQLIGKLDSARPDEVIYALDLLEQLEPALGQRYWMRLLNSPAPEVRTMSLYRIEQAGVPLDPAPIRALVERDSSPEVQEAALRAYCALVSSGAIEFVEPYLHAERPELQRGALVGMLRHTGIDGILLAGQKLNALLNSWQSTDRVLAAETLGGVGVQNFYQPLVRLLADEDPGVVQVALAAAGRVRHARLWPLVIDRFATPSVLTSAVQAIVAGSPDSLDEIERRLWLPDTPRSTRIWLLKACGRICGERVVHLLEDKLSWPDPVVRTHILMALSACCYRATGPALETIRGRIMAEAASAVTLLAHLVAFEHEPDTHLLAAALKQELQYSRSRVLLLLSFLYESKTILRAKQAFQRGTEAEQSYALEVLSIVTAKDLRRHVYPLFDTLADEQRLEQLSSLYPQQDLTLEERLWILSTEGSSSPWLRTVAMYTTDLVLPHAQAESLLLTLTQCTDPFVQKVAAEMLACQKEHTMLSTIEKVIILKTVNIFSGIPDGVLAELAGIVEEQEFRAGETIINKGDYGSSMYIIVSGKVRAHDGNLIFNTLGERDVFGEMAVLDPEPRVASITTEQDTLVFRLDQVPFYEVMADYPEISRAVIHVLIGYLRDRLQDVSRLNAQFAALKEDGADRDYAVTA